jgi:hypothetical protein
MDKRSRIIKWAKIGSVVGVGIALLEMFTVFGAADVPVARTLGRLIGGIVIFGAVGAVGWSFQPQRLEDCATKGW